MAEQRQPCATLHVSMRGTGRKISVRIYNASDWADQCRPGSRCKTTPRIFSSDHLANLYRVKVGRSWWPDLPRGEYRFYTWAEVFSLVADLAAGGVTENFEIGQVWASPLGVKYTVESVIDGKARLINREKTITRATVATDGWRKVDANSRTRENNKTFTG